MVRILVICISMASTSPNSGRCWRSTEHKDGLCHEYLLICPQETNYFVDIEGGRENKAIVVRLRVGLKEQYKAFLKEAWKDVPFNQG